MTYKQFRLLEFIKQFIDATETAPTYSQLKLFLGVTSNQTVSDLITALIKEGYLVKTHAKHQGLEVTTKAKAVSRTDLTVQKAVNIVPSQSNFAFGLQSSMATSLVRPVQNDNGGTYNLTISKRNPNVTYPFNH